MEVYANGKNMGGIYINMLMLTMVFQWRERRGEGEEKVQGLTPLCFAWIVEGVFKNPDLSYDPVFNVITQLQIQ